MPAGQSPHSTLRLPSLRQITFPDIGPGGALPGDPSGCAEGGGGFRCALAACPPLFLQLCRYKAGRGKSKLPAPLAPPPAAPHCRAVHLPTAQLHEAGRGPRRARRQDIVQPSPPAPPPLPPLPPSPTFFSPPPSRRRRPPSADCGRCAALRAGHCGGAAQRSQGRLTRTQLPANSCAPGSRTPSSLAPPPLTYRRPPRPGRARSAPLPAAAPPLCPPPPASRLPSPTPSPPPPPPPPPPAPLPLSLPPRTRRMIRGRRGRAPGSSREAASSSSSSSRFGGCGKKKKKKKKRERGKKKKKEAGGGLGVILY
eukprot:XP_025003496.1 proline-rich receptor-like protein kinase PERK2 [Gallus gallus]